MQWLRLEFGAQASSVQCFTFLIRNEDKCRTFFQKLSCEYSDSSDGGMVIVVIVDGDSSDSGMVMVYSDSGMVIVVIVGW